MAAACSIAVGSHPVPLPVVWEALVDYQAGDPLHTVVVDSRVPRTLVAIAVGVALGVSGALMQTITRNPLADPGILGVNAGASVAVVVAIAYFQVSSAAGYVWWALAGAAITSVLVYVLGTAKQGASTPARIALAGAALGIALTAATNMTLIGNETTFLLFRHWAVGSVQGRGMDVLAAVLPFLIVGVGLAFVLAHSLNAMALGDDAARSLGANAAGTRCLAALAVVLTAGAATAAVGPISFVGLAAPHVVRRITGANHWALLAGVALVAPAFLLSADVIGRVLVAPGELQTGIAAAVVGGPVFVALVRSRRLWAL